MVLFSTMGISAVRRDGRMWTEDIDQAVGIGEKEEVGRVWYRLFGVHQYTVGSSHWHLA